MEPAELIKALRDTATTNTLHCPDMKVHILEWQAADAIENMARKLDAAGISYGSAL